MTPTELIDHLLRTSSTLEQSGRLLAGLMSEEFEFEADGTLQLFGRRQRVDSFNGLTISINPNEHAPPHFHVNGQKINASFSILDGSHLIGDLKPKQRKAIEFWYPRSRALLVRIWNETRPSNCPVGPIIES